jgi:LysR family transcriptional regulator, hydrogen peroxide-inducible genes activator
MPVKTHQVGYFLALCEEQSFTRAARRCGVAQPSLTRAIQELESECGAPLFERGKTNVKLTGLGFYLKPEFVRVDRALSDVARKAAEFKTQSEVKVNSETKETYMRVVAVTVLAIAIIVIGLALRPTPSATAAVTDQTSNQVDPYALQSTTDIKALPWQTPDNLY